MPNNPELGAGGAGVDPNSQLYQDLQNMSDPAKAAARVAQTRQAAVEANAQQGLKAALDDQHQATMRSINDQHADRIMEGFNLDTALERHQYMKLLSKKISDIQKLAGDAKDKTGNMVAHNTYMQVSNILSQRLHSLQSEDTGTSPKSLKDLLSVTSTSQPAPSSQPTPGGGQ
jgi:hypothetical protein